VKHSGLRGGRTGDNTASRSLSPNDATYQRNGNQVVDFYKHPLLYLLAPILHQLQ
jgi:hypothetical protein